MKLLDELKEHVNKRLEDPELSQEVKAELCTMLEHCLFQEGKYHGFNYIYWIRQGCGEWEKAGRPEDPDTKKQYIGPEYDRMYY